LGLVLTLSGCGHGPDEFPLNGLRFVGYEGVERHGMYEIGFTLLWICGPISLLFGWSVLSSQAKPAGGCLLIMVPLTIFYALFFLVNWDYCAAFILGPIILAGSAGGAALKSIFGGNNK